MTLIFGVCLRLSVIKQMANLSEAVGADIHKISTEGGRIVMTTAMKLREEGKREGKIEDAKRMLSDGVSVEKTAQYTGLPLEDVKNIDIELN